MTPTPDSWVRWTKSPGGIATRVALAVFGIVVGLACLVLGLFILPLFTAMIMQDGSSFSHSTLTGVVSLIGLFVMIGTVTAAVKPSRGVLTGGAVALAIGTLLLLVVLTPL